jgi:hypothetical protein
VDEHPYTRIPPALARSDSPSAVLFGLLPSPGTASQARRDASHPATLRTSPHIPVRSFELSLSPQLAFRISVADARRSVATSLSQVVPESCISDYVNPGGLFPWRGSAALPFN